MKVLLKSLQSLFSFTNNEKKVIIILGFGLLLGLSIAGYQGFRADLDIADYSDIYSRTDVIFEEKIGSYTEDEITETGSIFLPLRSLNINTASQEELTMLPGIGEVYAGRIIEYRERYGTISSAEELLNIRGIGPKRLDQIQPYITYD